jgi:ATP-dependent 26S proteasome regulatory subunit
MGSGKTLCVRALATECNAMVIDISPSTIESKATDKNSIAKMFYMAFTVAKEF